MKIYNPSHVGQKKLVYFGPQTRKLLTLIHLHPNVLFSGDYILDLRGLLPPQIFTRATDWPRPAIAHPKEDGVPPHPKTITIVKT